MAFNSVPREVQIISAGAIASTSATGKLMVGLRPFRLRGVAIGVTTIVSSSGSCVLTLKYGAVDATTGGTTIDTLTISSTQAAGSVMVLRGLDTLVTFGQAVYAYWSTESTSSGNASVTLLIEEEIGAVANAVAAGTIVDTV